MLMFILSFKKFFPEIGGLFDVAVLIFFLFAVVDAVNGFYISGFSLSISAIDYTTGGSSLTFSLFWRCEE